ncbi:MAG: response regulator [Desulfobulbaceae bacterium]|nr:response regulator [Desulfobulbaceae bacterium]
MFVIDDDPSARKGLARLLLTAGHNVRDFESANDFLDALNPDVSGCLVLDARMPGLSGEELHVELKNRKIYLPIIVVTGDDDPQTRKNATKMKAVGFFRKPVDGTALLDAVNWAFRSRKTDNGHELK